MPVISGHNRHIMASKAAEIIEFYCKNPSSSFEMLVIILYNKHR